MSARSKQRSKGGNASKGTQAPSIDDPDLVALYARVVREAKHELRIANAEREHPNDWPSGMTWDQLINTSRHTFIHYACEKFGISYEKLRERIRAADDDERDQIEEIFGRMRT